MGSPYGGKRSSHSTLSGTRFKMLHLQPHSYNNSNIHNNNNTNTNTDNNNNNNNNSHGSNNDDNVNGNNNYGGDVWQCVQPGGISKCPCSKYTPMPYR